MDYSFEVGFGNAKGEASQFTQILSALGKVLISLESREKTLQDGFSKLEQSFRANASAAKEHATAQRQSTAAQTDAEKEAKRLKDAQDNTHKSLKSWFESLTKSAGIWNTWNKAVRFAVDDIRILTRVFSDAIKKLEEFGGAEARAQVGIETFGGTKEQQAALKKQADDLSRTYRSTRAQIKEAQTELLKAGMSAPQVEATLPAAMMISKAEGMSIQDVGGKGAAVSAQFKEQGVDATKAILLMKAAADASQTSFQGASAAITNAARDLAPAKVAIEDIATMTALAAERGITFGRAGTSMSAAWRTMAKGGAAYQKALKEINVSDADMRKAISKPLEIIGLLENKIKPLSPADRIRILNNIFGTYGGSAMNALVMQGVGAYKKMQEEVLKEAQRNTGGRQFESMQKSWTSAIDGMRTAGKNLWATLSNIANTPLAEFFGGIEKIIFKVEDRFKSLEKVAQANGGGLSGWMQAISQQGVKGLFSGLVEDAGGDIAQVKEAFTALVSFTKNLFAEIWNTFVDENTINAISAKVKELLAKIFSPENVNSGIAVGLEFGNQVLQGIMKSGLWKWIVAGLVLKVSLSLASAAMTLFSTQLSAALAPVIAKVATQAVAAAMTNVASVKTASSFLNQTLSIGGGAAGIAAGGVLAVSIVGITAAAAAMLWTHTANKMADAAEEESNIKQGNEVAKQLQQLYTKKTPLTEEQTQRLQNLEGEYKKLTGQYSPFKKQYETEQGRIRQNAQGARRFGEDQRALFEQAQAEGVTIEELKARRESNVVETRRTETGELQWQDKQGQWQSKKTGMTPPPFEATWQDAITGEQRRISSKEQFRDQQRGKYGSEWFGYGEVGQAAGVSEMSDAQITQEQNLLKAKQDVIDAEKQHAQALEQSKNILIDSEKEINNVGAALKEWLVNPVDTFTQKLLEAREKFGGLLDALSGKKIDLAEKFGLTTKEGATKERTDLLTKQQERDARLMGLAQTPEEQARIAERMAGRQEKLAEFATSEGDKKAAAQKGMEYYTQAEQATERAQADEEERLRIRRDTAEKNLGQDEQAVQNAQTAGERAARLSALLSDYQSLGPKYKEKAIEAEAEWEKAKREADAETSKNIATTAKMSVLTVELLRRIAEKAGVDQQQTSFDALAQENSDYSDIVVNS